MSNHHFTEAENKAWLANLPKKSLAVKVIIKSSQGNILLVKPNYKPGWQLLGGGVEPNEDPREAAVREANEELGLELDTSQLKLLDTVFRREHDNLILIYEYLKNLDETKKLAFSADELEGVKFESPESVSPQLGDYYATFWASYIAA